jgi:hypothetical protein
MLLLQVARRGQQMLALLALVGLMGWVWLVLLVVLGVMVAQRVSLARVWIR